MPATAGPGRKSDARRATGTGLDLRRHSIHEESTAVAEVISAVHARRMPSIVKPDAHNDSFRTPGRRYPPTWIVVHNGAVQRAFSPTLPVTQRDAICRCTTVRSRLAGPTAGPRPL